MEEKWLELWKQKHRRSHSVNLTDTCVCPWVSFSQTYYSLWNRDGNDSLIGVVWWGLNKKSKALRALPVCTGPSVDIQAHTLPVCSGDMTSSTCSQWTVVTSPSLPWLEPSCSVLSEGEFFPPLPTIQVSLAKWTSLQVWNTQWLCSADFLVDAWSSQIVWALNLL